MMDKATQDQPLVTASDHEPIGKEGVLKRIRDRCLYIRRGKIKGDPRNAAPANAEAFTHDNRQKGPI